MAPLRVRVGADGRGEVLGPGRSWAFEVEFGARSAVLVDASGTTTVRPPTWRERSSLAQFASLGDAFCMRSLARACASRRTAVAGTPMLGDARPDASEEGLGDRTDGRPGDDVIVAIAAWLEDPLGNLALPADTDGLAAITLDLCRRTGLRPAEIGDLPAFEVAQLWTAAGIGDGASGGQAGSRTGDERWGDASDATSKIVIVDDVVPDGAAEARVEAGAGPGFPDPAQGPTRTSAEDRVETASVPDGGALSDGAPWTPDRRPVPRTAPEVVSAAANRVPGRARLRVRRVAANPPTLGGGHSTSADLAPAAGPLPATTSSPGPEGHPISASWPTAPAGRGAPGVAPPLASAAAPSHLRPAVASVAPREPSAGAVVRERRDALVPAARRTSDATVPGPEAFAPVASLPASWLTPAAPLTERDWNDEASSGGALAPGAGDALLAQLADELERAAVLLGIGEEG